MSSTKPVRLGLIGTGIFASESHYPAIASSPSLELAACANRSIDKAIKFASQTGVTESKVYDSLAKLLADPDVDAIDALLPAQFTLSTVRDAVAAGKPIAIEKPIAATIEQARQVVAIANSTPLPVAVLENFAYWNVIDAVKAALPDIGDVIYFSHYCTAPFNTKNSYLATWWRQKPEHAGGLLSDGGVHQVALFTEILGQVESVSGLTTQVRVESGGDVDSMTTTLKMKSGVLGSFTYTSAVSNPRINRLSIHGRTGTLIYDFADKSSPVLTLYTDTDKTGTAIPVVPETPSDIAKEFENFAEAVRKNDKSVLKVPPEKAFHHLAIICAVIESAQNGGTAVKVAVP